VSDQHIANSAPLQPYEGVVEVAPRRPVGVTVIALGSLLLAVLGAISLVKHSLGDATLLGRVPTCLGATYIAVIAFMGVGLWKQRSWARDTALWIFGVYAAIHLFDFFLRPQAADEWAVILISTGIFVYLLIPAVRRRFD
jgi:uncharacterized membrane protein (DUF2068 family)